MLWRGDDVELGGKMDLPVIGMNEVFPGRDVVGKPGDFVTQHRQVIIVKVKRSDVRFPQPDPIVGFQQTLEKSENIVFVFSARHDVLSFNDRLA